MSDIQPGDLVVCVDASPPTSTHHGESPVAPVHTGSVHRVTDLIMTFEGIAFLLDGEAPHTCRCCFGTSGWRPTRFRKLNDEPDNAELIARIKSCRPVKQGVSA